MRGLVKVLTQLLSKAGAKKTGIERAIKILPKSITDAELFEVEIKSLMALDHPHVVKVLEYFDEGENFYIVFELIDGPDLVQYLIKRAKELQNYIPEDELAIIMRQVLKSILSCHERGIIHRDIKLENFMIAGEEMIVKMIDLGLASTKDDAGAVWGSYRYMAPEIYFSKTGYDTGVDIWALGVALYTLLTFDTLLPDEREDVQKCLSGSKSVENNIKKCKLLKERNLSKQGRNFLNQLLAYDPKKRITAEAALQHPFIQKTGNRALHEMQFQGQISSDIVANMETFAHAIPLQKIGQLAIAHVVSQRPDKELTQLRLMFRKLNVSGNGHLSLAEIEDGFNKDGITLPSNFREIFAACSSSGDTTVNFTEFIGCNIPKSFVNEKILTRVFSILDRDDNNLLGPEDFKIIYASVGAKEPEFCEKIIFEATGKSSITQAEFINFMLNSK